MNNNSSKQILLSVIGVAILVVAVVGVSFAFFTYTRTGDEDNVITTGSIVFSFEDTSYINLTNQFPVDTATDVVAGSEEDEVDCVFYVEGNAPAGTTISYNVYAVPTNATTQANYTGKTPFTDREISVQLTAVRDNGDTTNNTFAFEHGVDGVEGVAISSLVGDDNQFDGLLATGTMVGDAANTSRKVTFTAKMWVDSDFVHIDEQGTAVAGKTVYTSAQFGQKFYTMRIRVDANA